MLKSSLGADHGGQPFARGQEKPLQTGPFLGGFIYVLTAAVAAGGTVTAAPGFVPRVVRVEAVPTGFYPSRVQRGASTVWTARAAQVTFESAQPIGTALFFY